MSSFKFEVWPTEYRTINQYFGANPQNYARFGLPGHEGIDIMAPTGSKIFAVAPGRVVKVHKTATGHNYGIHVRVAHVDGYQTTYAHFQQTLVEVNDEVQAGALLGLADDTGNSFGSHLHLTLKKEGAHFENWPYNIIDPTPFLLPLMGWKEPAGPYTEGWVYTAGTTIIGNLAQANSGGVNLRQAASVYGTLIDLVPGGTIMIVRGEARGQYTPVKVPTAALSNSKPAPPPEPGPPPPPTVATINGWGWRNYLTVTGNQAVVGQYGINLRAQPDKNSANYGLVKGGGTVTVLASAHGDYLPIQVRRSDFQGPVNLPKEPPKLDPNTGLPPPGSYVGWAWTNYLTITARQAVVGPLGINLRRGPTTTAQNIGLLKGGATVNVIGLSRGEYTPVLAYDEDVLNRITPPPDIEPYDPFPGPGHPITPPEQPPQDTTPGWAFTEGIAISGDTAVVGTYGINLRDAPRRNATNLGFVPADTRLIVTGAAQGEYTPVRVDDNLLKPPVGVPSSTETTTPPETPDPDPPMLGRARIGLHASADPVISDAEIKEFATMRPGMIKLLSFHDPAAIQKLVAAHPDVSWVVRAFLDFGGRDLSPAQFLQFTINDVKRTLNLLQGKDVVVELHNEPNIVPEGLGSSWSNGADFAQWWLELLDRYRQSLPDTRFIYPGLSPGPSVTGIKHDHIQFMEASREAVEAADGLGVHIYWSNVYPMERGLDVLDDYISRFRYNPIWITEASNNKDGTSTYMKGRQYLKFWQELQSRPIVQGVTYFVASASNPDFASEVWVGRGIARIVGRR
ncbi:MAG: peptidoglycan DD-metalloendopeptidase family protein [Anaerolineae bacterium]